MAPASSTLFSAERSHHDLIASSVANIPVIEGILVSSIVTSSVTALTRLSPEAARCPSISEVVMPPAHTPSTLQSGLPVISQAAAIASLHAVTYSSRRQLRSRGVGLRQLIW